MENYEELEKAAREAWALQSSLALWEWDRETLAPEAAGEQTAKTAGVLSGLYYEWMTGSRMGELLAQEAPEVTGKEDFSQAAIQKRMMEELAKEREQLSCVPKKEYEDFARLTSSATKVWEKAKKKQDVSLFAPVLEEIIQGKKKIASYRKKDGQSLYEEMLSEFEDSFPEKKLDEFFALIREELAPFLEKIRREGRKIDNSFLFGDFSEKKQEKLARMMAEYIGVDGNRCVLAVSAHPFTTSFHNKDVRLTTHYDQWLDHSLFSVIHEGGHALYELGVDDRLTQTILGQGASMAMHESQSRFMENVIGRSRPFWEPVYGRVQRIFPDELGKISLDDFVAAINRSEPGLIRTNADELTYSLHIMVRYDLEKELMEGRISVKDLEKSWEEKYEKYLGVRPEHPSEGVLQDIHWSQGSFGYFPSYALGSAFAAQIYEKMKEQMDVEGLLKKGEVKAVTEYLRKNIHRFGKMKTSRQILTDVTGEDFNPNYYIQYLKKKYGELYL